MPFAFPNLTTLTSVPYYDALAISAAVSQKSLLIVTLFTFVLISIHILQSLILKAAIVRLLVVRQRIAADNWVWPEDPSGLTSVAPLFRLMLFTSSPVLTSKELFERFQATDRNNMDNEPIFLIAALAWGYLTNGNPASYAVKLLYSIVASRFVHNFGLISKTQPLRALAFCPPFFGTVFITIQTLIAAANK